MRLTTLFTHNGILKSINFSRSISFGKEQQFPLKYHKLDGHNLGSVTSLSKQEALNYFKNMTTIRLMENKCGKLYMEKAIKGFCHLYSGQEACAVGMQAAIDKNDSVITAYRCHGWAYLKGAPIRNIISELTGRVTGCSKGKGGSMHIFANEFYGGNGIVGAQVPLGAGIALSHSLKKDGRICLTLYGDGAANQGQVFETFNMSALWKLPVVFVCENNLYGMGTSIERSSASTNFYSRGDFIPGIKVDGSCVLSVREATRFCRDWCLSGKGPILIEVVTYRYSGHSMSDPGTSYRKTEEVQNIRKTRDPILTFSSLITNSGLVQESELNLIREELENEVEKAGKQALEDSFPDISDLGTYVYNGEVKKGCVRGNEPFTYY